MTDQNSSRTEEHEGRRRRRSRARADTEALTAMSAVTGAEMYQAQDPQQVREVVLEAIGRRACRPHC